MKKIVSTMVIAVFLISLFAIVPTSVAAVSMPPKTAPGAKQTDRPTVKSDNDLEGIDGTSRYENLVIEGAQPDTGNPWDVFVIDDYYGGFYVQTFECVLQGVYANIWIGQNPLEVWPGGYADEYDDNSTPEIDDDTWYFAYPWSSIGIPGEPDPDEDGYYLPPGYRDTITGENLLYVLDQFDNNIHDTVTEHFGMYADRPGPFDDYKIQILIFNIRDGLFYDPITAPWFIEGYFWSYASYINNANIFHMDTYQWWRRLGNPIPPLPYGLSPRPFEYEGTFAHEFQHLVHRDVDPDEMSWVNEGCSTLAEYICGYGFSPGHISEYLYWFWDTSLVIWQGYLSNYGAVFLWTFYMYEHYGGDPLIWDLVHEQANGIEGWSNVLRKHRIRRSFDKIFQDWAIANYLDDTSFAKGRYGYYALDIPSDDTEGLSIPLMMELWESWYPNFFDWQVDTYPNSGYNYPYRSSLPYQVNYVQFFDGVKALKFKFDGDDNSGILPHSGSYEWYSDGTSYSWFRLGQTFKIPTGGATLKFWTNYEIETNWDYGYVEVHVLESGEWYTLPGITTVSTLPNPQNNTNCPEENEPTTYLAAGRWNAFTGFSSGWYQEVMDLTPFAGYEIELYFTYWTDPYTLELGWYIDDIEIPELGFFDDVESGENGWTVNAGWYITDGAIPNDFEVSFIQTMTITKWKWKYEKTRHHIQRMYLHKITEEGYALLWMTNTKRVSSYAIMVAANQPGFEHTFGTGYTFEVDIWKPHKCH